MTKNLCKKLAIAILIVGSIGAFVLAYFCGDSLTLTQSGALTHSRSWGLTISVFLVEMLMVLILYAILIALAELLEKQEANSEKLKELLKELNENYRGEAGKVSSKVTSPSTSQTTAFGTSKRQHFSEEEKKILAQGGWECPKCGRINHGFMSVCQSCSTSRP